MENKTKDKEQVEFVYNENMEQNFSNGSKGIVVPESRYRYREKTFSNQ